MSKLLVVQYACEMAEDLPTENDFACWVEAVFQKLEIEVVALTIRVVDLEEMQTLNRDFRQQDKPTNVLSFPFEPFPHETTDYLGDIAICAPVVREEATEQGKAPMFHWAHMTIHGVLHLLGYDHVKDVEAEEMEALEAEILNAISN